MTSGADDALFGQDDGTGPGGYEPAGKQRAAAVPMASTSATPATPATSATPAPGAVERPAAAAPGWITGESAPPWPPRGASNPAPGPPGPPARPARPGQPARSGAPAGPPPRPRVVEDPGILGLSRRTRGRFGSRVFTWFFVLVFVLIAAQMVASIVWAVDPW